MTRQSDESRETRMLLGLFARVAVLVPLCYALLAFGTIQYLGLEVNAKLIRTASMLGWLLTMAALALTFYRYLRSVPRDRVPRHVVSRFDWETRADARSARDLMRACIIIPLCSSALVWVYHLFVDPFESSRELRTLVVILLLLWILMLAMIAFATRKRRIG